MSFNTSSAKTSLESFENHYEYDASYLHEVLDASPEGFEAFSKFGDMGMYRKTLSPEVFFVSKIAAAQTEDCGPCTKLNVRMAREAGVSDQIIRGAMTGKGLRSDLEAVRVFSIAVAFNEVRPGQVEEMIDSYGREGLAELALSIASMRVYPCMKRALGFDQSCAVASITI
ncbi:MAG: carboxymuconolactone decarboxylase family protein [Opitutales bacterium]|jgi:AhpD family alkylhydroperoxidase|nr:carboxymuconolactone decarboxylase family protein [Opitutales bacterium]